MYCRDRLDRSHTLVPQASEMKVAAILAMTRATRSFSWGNILYNPLLVDDSKG